uniref:Uncharacterized protein n=1 Tax=Arundo donax TaxID=35708 RepID=A0A0A9GRA8_ARUDO
MLALSGFQFSPFFLGLFRVNYDLSDT